MERQAWLAERRAALIAVYDAEAAAENAHCRSEPRARTSRIRADVWQVRSPAAGLAHGAHAKADRPPSRRRRQGLVGRQDGGHAVPGAGEGSPSGVRRRCAQPGRPGAPLRVHQLRARRSPAGPLRPLPSALPTIVAAEGQHQSSPAHAPGRARQQSALVTRRGRVRPDPVRNGEAHPARLSRQDLTARMCVTAGDTGRHEP
jgi:hypothetical protein